MRVTMLVVTLLILMPPPVRAGSFAITTTPERDAALAAQLAEPTVFTAKGQAPKTPERYIQDLVNEHLDHLKGHHDDRKAREEFKARGKK